MTAEHVPTPMSDENLADLRAYLVIEESEEGGADGLCDYYETTKRLLATVDVLRAEVERADLARVIVHADLVKAEAERDAARREVAFFAERLEKQDGQYSHGHPAAVRYRALREGLEEERAYAWRQVAITQAERDRYRNVVDEFLAAELALTVVDRCEAERTDQLDRYRAARGELVALKVRS